MSFNYDGNFIHLKVFDMVFIKELLDEGFQLFVSIITDFVGIFAIKVTVRIQHGIKPHDSPVVHELSDNASIDESLQGLVYRAF